MKEIKVIRPTGMEAKNGVPMHTGDTNFILALFLGAGGSEFRQPFSQSGWIYTATDILAKNFSGVELGVYEGSRRDKRLIEDGPLHELFTRINPRMSQSQALYAWTVHMKITGESFWILTDRNGDPVARENQLPEMVWPLPGNCVSHQENARGDMVEYWEVKHGNKSTRLEPWQVIQFAYYNPENPLRGLAPATAAAQAARTIFKAAGWNEAVLDNDGVPAGFFHTDLTLDPEARKEFKEDQDQSHGGWTKRGKAQVLEGGMKFQPSSVSHREMEFMDLVKQARDEVLSIMRVPPFEAGLVEDVNRATAVASKAKLFEGAIIPDQRLFSDTLNKFAERWGGEWVWYDNKDVEALKAGLTEKIEQAERLVALGWDRNAVNERLDLGLPALPANLNVNTVPTTLQLLEDVADPLDDAVMVDDEEQAPPPSPDPDQDEDDNQERAGAVHVKRPATIWHRLEREVMRPSIRTMKSRLVGHMKVDRNKTLRALSAADRRDFGRLREKLLALPPIYCSACGELVFTSGRVVTPKDVDFGDIEDILFNLEESNGRIFRLFRPIYRALTQSVLNFTETELGGLEVVEQDTPAIETFLEEKELKLARVNDYTRERVRAQLLKGIRAGDSIQQLTRRVKKGFRGAASAARRLRIARTETAQAADTVRHIAFEHEGITEHQWVTAGDEHVRESHARLNGERRALGEPFSNGLIHPNDPNGPAREVINCRCVATAVT